jgi:hypothetical protein
VQLIFDACSDFVLRNCFVIGVDHIEAEFTGEKNHIVQGKIHRA